MESCYLEYRKNGFLYLLHLTAVFVHDYGRLVNVRNATEVASFHLIFYQRHSESQVFFFNSLRQWGGQAGSLPCKRPKGRGLAGLRQRALPQWDPGLVARSARGFGRSVHRAARLGSNGLLCLSVPGSRLCKREHLLRVWILQVHAVGCSTEPLRGFAH